MAENGVIKKLTPAERSFYTAAEDDSFSAIRADSRRKACKGISLGKNPKESI